LSNNATATVSYDEVANTVNVDSVAYTVNSNIVLDSRKVSVIEYG